MGTNSGGPRGLVDPPRPVAGMVRFVWIGLVNSMDRTRLWSSGQDRTRTLCAYIHKLAYILDWIGLDWTGYDRTDPGVRQGLRTPD